MQAAWPSCRLSRPAPLLLPCSGCNLPFSRLWLPMRCLSLPSLLQPWMDHGWPLWPEDLVPPAGAIEAHLRLQAAG